jgi:homoserine O-acetyltransferase
MSEWIQKAQSTQLEVRNFKFFDDRSLDSVLHCRTLGAYRLGNAVLQGTTGSGKQFLQPEMAHPLFAPGGPLDVEKYFVVLPDAIGHGQSSKPSDGLEQDFPRWIWRHGRGPASSCDGRIGNTSSAPRRWNEHGRNANLDVGRAFSRDDGRIDVHREPPLQDNRSKLADAADHDSGNPQRSRAWTAGRVGLSARNWFAWQAFKLLTESPARMAEDLVHPDRADELIETVAAEAMRTEHPNDVIWEFDASRDYDPEPEPDKIQAPLVAVNFCDDELNQPGQCSLVIDDDDNRQATNGCARSISGFEAPGTGLSVSASKRLADSRVCRAGRTLLKPRYSN